MGPRDRECKSPRPDHHFQACGPVRGAPPCEGGEAGANPVCLTIFLGTEMKESNRAPVTGESAGASPVVPATFRDVAKQLRHLAYTQAFRGCKSLRLDHFSFWCGRQARHRAVNSTHEGALPSTRATFISGHSSAAERAVRDGEVAGAIPVVPTTFTPGSSNSRTRGFGPQNRGASPRPGASFRRKRGVQIRRTAGLLNRNRGHARRGAVPLSSATFLGGVAQRFRAAGSYPAGRGRKSHRPHDSQHGSSTSQSVALIRRRLSVQIRPVLPCVSSHATRSKRVAERSASEVQFLPPGPTAFDCGLA